MVFFLSSTAILLGQTSGVINIEVGRKSEVIKERIETNFQDEGPAFPLVDSSESGFIPASPGVVRPPDTQDFREILRKRFPHLYDKAEKVLPKTKISRDSLPKVLSDGQTPGGGSGIRVNGVGSSEGVALGDGNVSIGILLKTYNPAFMEVRVYDPDGTEVTFSGKPLLSWRRPNDSADAPVEFQGAADDDSMRKVGPNDYSPRDGLSYDFFLKKGQRIVIKTGGNALKESFIKVSGENL